MNDRQELVSLDSPFQPAPMPRNEQEAHTLLVIVIVTWVLGFALLLWIDWKKKK